MSDSENRAGDCVESEFPAVLFEWEKYNNIFNWILNIRKLVKENNVLIE